MGVKAYADDGLKWLFGGLSCGAERGRGRRLRRRQCRFEWRQLDGWKSEGRQMGMKTGKVTHGDRKREPWEGVVQTVVDVDRG